MTQATPPPAPGRKLRFNVPWSNVVGIIAIVLAATLVTGKHLHRDTSQNQILNVSYDPTREVFATLDKSFVEQYRQHNGIALEVKQSHGGSGRQARDVIDGKQKVAYNVIGAFENEVRAKFGDGSLMQAVDALLQSLSIGE